MSCGGGGDGGGEGGDCGGVEGVAAGDLGVVLLFLASSMFSLVLESLECE